MEAVDWEDRALLRGESTTSFFYPFRGKHIPRDGDVVEVVYDWQPPTGERLTDPPPVRLPVRVDAAATVELVNAPALDAAVRSMLLLRTPSVGKPSMWVDRRNATGPQQFVDNGVVYQEMEATDTSETAGMSLFVQDKAAGVGLPVAVALRPVIRLPDGTEYKGQSRGVVAHVDAGSGREIYSLTVNLPVPTPRTVTLVLRPDVEAAERTLDVRGIWGGEIVYEDVPVLVEE